MLKPEFLNTIAEQLKDIVPVDVLSDAIKSAMSSMDLVSREEFDIQAKVLFKTRKKLSALEQRVTELEKIHKSNN